MYRCAKCGTEFDRLMEKSIRCPNCAFRIVYKTRDATIKTIQAR